MNMNININVDESDKILNVLVKDLKKIQEICDKKNSSDLINNLQNLSDLINNLQNSAVKLKENSDTNLEFAKKLKENIDTNLEFTKKIKNK